MATLSFSLKSARGKIIGSCFPSTTTSFVRWMEQACDPGCTSGSAWDAWKSATMKSPDHFLQAGSAGQRRSLVSSCYQTEPVLCWGSESACSQPRHQKESEESSDAHRAACSKGTLHPLSEDPLPYCDRRTWHDKRKATMTCAVLTAQASIECPSSQFVLVVQLCR